MCELRFILLLWKLNSMQTKTAIDSKVLQTFRLALHLQEFYIFCILLHNNHINYSNREINATLEIYTKFYYQWTDICSEFLTH